MKMCKIRGQISLELIMLILVALLGAVVVGVTIPNNLVNITSVEDTKEVVFEGFIRGGGTPVYVGGGGGSSDNDTEDNGSTTGDTGDSTDTEDDTSDNENDSDTGEDSSNSEEDPDTEEGNDGTEEGDNNETTTDGGRAESLYLKLNGNSMSNITSDVIPGGESLSEYIRKYGTNITVPGGEIKKFNVDGTITEDVNIKVNGNGELQLGNLSEVGTLTLKIVGNAGRNLGVTLDIRKID
ncbi:class III signal peptide-containing protein, partial [Methanothermococcus sp. SCGC AD-155-N22]|nr:class III signal peptide-containing protein [Methanothermococcus sp. SCGC AD-155-N22]MBW9220376.1 class III signal peptide-containing protein [Methanothermococcus sp. SCGC AD-155-N22]